MFGVWLAGAFWMWTIGRARMVRMRDEHAWVKASEWARRYADRCRNARDKDRAVAARKLARDLRRAPSAQAAKALFLAFQRRREEKDGRAWQGWTWDSSGSFGDREGWTSHSVSWESSSSSSSSSHSEGRDGDVLAESESFENLSDNS